MGLPVIIADYDPAWPTHYRRTHDALSAATEGYVTRIEHIGSTSVSGLAAKPIIDVMLGVDDARLLDVSAEETSATCGPRGVEPAGLDPHVELVRAITSLGYIYLGFHGLTDRLYLRCYVEEPGVHIHMVERTSAFWRRHVLFRDYLRAHADEAHAYARIKRELATQYPNDRDGYTDAKTNFITTRERRAEAWHAREGGHA